jgi:hypothetical protein
MSKSNLMGCLCYCTRMVRWTNLQIIKRSLNIKQMSLNTWFH